MNEKLAVITMDVEDWYHTGYLAGNDCDRTVSILNTVDWFCDILEANGARATLFVLGELIPKMGKKLNALSERGFEIASHAWSHTPPLKLTPAQLKDEIQQCQNAHWDFISAPLEGFRAPLFSLDRPRLEHVIEAGFLYDSSCTARGRKSATLQLGDFVGVREQIYRHNDFFEFQVGAPGYGAYFINGGGGTRLLPWSITLRLLRGFLRDKEFYNFYVHPVDLSTQELPLPSGMSALSRLRMLKGRGKMIGRFEQILHEIGVAGFKFVTFAQFRGLLLDEPVIQRQSQ